MPIDGFSPLRIQSFREPSPPPTPPAAPANAPSLGARDRLARRDSAFEGTARLPARVTPDLRPMGPGPSIPPLSPEEQQALGSALPPTGGPQMPWSRNDGYPQPTALAGTMMARAREQGLLSTSQVDRSASVANRAVPDAQLRQLSAGDVGAMAREAGVPVERLDPGQLQQASRLINGATTPQEQRDRIALSLNNLSVAAGGRMPELSRQDMQAMLWAEAKVPGHAVEGLSDSALRGVFSQVTQATNHPGSHELTVGDHTLDLTVGQDGSLQHTETKPPSFWSRLGGALAAPFVALGTHVLKPALDSVLGVVHDGLSAFGIHPTFGPPYPTTPEAQRQDEARIHQQLGQAIDQLPPWQREVLDQVRGLGVSDSDLFRASHVVVNDGGQLYDRWRELGATPRSSSHYPDVHEQQYEFEFPGIGPMLFGLDARGNTWFQFEAHSGAGVNPDHLWDYFKYRLSGLQVGPAGTSPHTDSNPLNVSYHG